ncbi:Uma2 family endonuclease [Streptomyces sp. ET3-23]|uniref:Uma2 family endonuclease n=1 Tax=Streptomyces sp. ET3-23 TaxID=2885643 RepID=UPI001D12D344|nr:Uma2 family endonuclease [Streptomyces sp. ET3-23]MCC2277255.1 Uma2 family endonuclease [Streptomyces sp. ET3-23]
MTAALPEWLYPPRDSGWEADDLDTIPDLPRHTELIDGALTFMMSPQRSWHDRVIRRLASALEDQAPEAHTVEVVSDESQEWDRETKPFKYARAGIPHFWRIEEERGLPVVHSYELDETTRAYVATGIHRERIKTSVPFGIDIDLVRLVR